jgi:hypothetical protein
VSFLISLRTQNRQDKKRELQANLGLIQQLRSQYPRITSLEKQPNGRELETALGVGAVLLHRLGKAATGQDYFFIGDSYRSDHFPEIAVPLYKEAIARLNEQPASQIAALRGLAYADVLVEQPEAAHVALTRALEVNANSGYPQIARYNNEANTQRVWVTVAATARECGEVRQHARRYFQVLRHLPGPNWSPAPGDVTEVATEREHCR